MKKSFLFALFLIAGLLTAVSVRPAFATGDETNSAGTQNDPNSTGNTSASGDTNQDDNKPDDGDVVDPPEETL
jgi:hypothetical protein